jgi:hypothetical protein
MLSAVGTVGRNRMSTIINIFYMYEYTGGILGIIKR